MVQVEIFVQGEGISNIKLIKVDADSPIGDILKAAKTEGLLHEEDVPSAIFLEDEEAELDIDDQIENAGISNRSRVHINRCRRVDVTVNFDCNQILRKLRPSATMRRVKRWAVSKEGFDLSKTDAAEHVLQICNSVKRPDEDIHIGTLVQFPDCIICFDLVPKQRVEG